MKVSVKIFAIVVVIGAIAVLFAGPAAASAAGSGAVIGTSSTDADFPNNPNNNMPPPFCARSKDTDLRLALRGTLTVNGQTAAGTANVHANTNGVHFFGPQGTYSNSSCSPTTLGPLGPISITVDAYTFSGGLGTASCSATSGQYWRVNTHVHLSWTTSCTIAGQTDGDVGFTVDGEQEPVSLTMLQESDPVEGAYSASSL